LQQLQTAQKSTTAAQIERDEATKLSQQKGEQLQIIEHDLTTAKQARIDADKRASGYGLIIFLF
jgi:hypothetical protein